MDEYIIERLLLDLQNGALPSYEEDPRLDSLVPNDPLVNSTGHDLELLAWIDEQMSEVKRLAERFGLVGLLPGIALTRSGITKEVQRLVKSCCRAASSAREPTECRVLPFPVRAGQ